MRKYLCFGLMVSVLPSLCLAENPRITKLMREKQAKMEQLERCMGSTKGLKIAGISTLGLTAVGVAGNIAEAKAIKDYNSQIEATDKKIEKTRAEIEEKEAQIAEKEEKEQKRQEAIKKAQKEGRLLSKVALADIDRINRSGYIGDRAVSHGYMPERLPDNLRNQFANAMVSFIERCRSLVGMNGIKEVSLSPSVQENWRQFVGASPLEEDAVLDDLNEHLIAECKITECDLTTHSMAYNGSALYCVANSSATSDSTVAGQGNGDSQDGSSNSGTQGNGGSQDGSSGSDTQSGDGNGSSDGTSQSGDSGSQGAQGGENGQAGNGNQGAGDGTTTKPDGTDCTADAQKTETDTEKAEYKGGVCKITKCKTATNEPNKDGNKCAAKTATKPDGTDCKTSLNNNEVKEAKIEGGACKIKSCITGKKPSEDGKSCVDKASTEWTDEEKKDKPDNYCSTTYKSDAAKACCLAIHKYNKATSWDGVGMKCNCKEGVWIDNFCTVDETVFKDTKVSSVDDGKKLVAIWAKRKGKTLIFKSSEVNKTGQDYLSYATSDGVEKYKFEFDSMNESDSHTRNYAIFDIVCSLYDGRPAGSKYKTLAKNGISGSPRSCAGAPEDLKEWCKNIGVSLSGIDKNLGTVLDQNMLGGQTCYKR